MTRTGSCLSLAILSILLVGACGGGSNPADPRTGPPSVTSSEESVGTADAAPVLEGRLVYTKAGGRYGDGTIFTSNADGTDEEELKGPGATCCMRVDPTGGRVLFAGLAGQRVTVGIQHLSGDRPRYLPLPPGTLNLGPGAWSPDGKQIAVQGWDDRHPDQDGIYVVDSADGGQRARWTHEGGQTVHVPVHFSPDGRWLVYLEEHPDTPSDGRLFVLDARDLSRRPVTPRDMAVGMAARFSQDGTRILFADGRTSPGGALWVVAPDGADLKQIWNEYAGFASFPAWSPDGERIIFSLGTGADYYAHSPNALAVIEADGTSLYELLRDGDYRREATWIE